ncbi:hypothetical protein AAFF_G00201850 [Aldrovandia affinis]|uniref:Uncharacterized protein n=1 Tax=Aldrovandia affinis TaxID=143900 RepID=A0AAD7WVX2_9TELE|nr:hypothetical protein AAFF_G00201850 [Aldrovandia affinis]
MDSDQRRGSYLTSSISPTPQREPLCRALGPLCNRAARNLTGPGRRPGSWSGTPRSPRPGVHAEIGFPSPPASWQFPSIFKTFWTAPQLPVTGFSRFRHPLHASGRFSTPRLGGPGGGAVGEPRSPLCLEPRGGFSPGALRRACGELEPRGRARSRSAADPSPSPPACQLRCSSARPAPDLRTPGPSPWQPGGHVGRAPFNGGVSAGRPPLCGGACLCTRAAERSGAEPDAWTLRRRSAGLTGAQTCRPEASDRGAAGGGGEPLLSGAECDSGSTDDRSLVTYSAQGSITGVRWLSAGEREEAGIGFNCFSRSETNPELGPGVAALSRASLRLAVSGSDLRDHRVLLRSRAPLGCSSNRTRSETRLTLR